MTQCPRHRCNAKRESNLLWGLTRAHALPCFGVPKMDCSAISATEEPLAIAAANQHPDTLTWLSFGLQTLQAMTPENRGGGG